MNHTELFQNFKLSPGARICGWWFSVHPDGFTVAGLAAAAGFSRESANKYCAELVAQNLIMSDKAERKHGRTFRWVTACLSPEAE